MIRRKRMNEKVEDPCELLASLVDMGSVELEDAFLACLSEMSAAECKRVLAKCGSGFVCSGSECDDDFPADVEDMKDLEPVDDEPIDLEDDDKDMDDEDDDMDDEDAELEARCRRLERCARSEAMRRRRFRRF